MHEVSLFRLYVLRAMYLFIVVGLAAYLWPGILDPDRHWELMQGQATCMLAAFSLIAGPVVGSDLEDALAPARAVPAMACRSRR